MYHMLFVGYGYYVNIYKAELVGLWMVGSVLNFDLLQNH